MQRAHQVVLDVGDRRVANARRELKRVFCHNRSLDRVGERCVNAEDLQRVDQLLRHLADIAVVRRGLLKRIEQGKGWQDVGALVLRRLSSL